MKISTIQRVTASAAHALLLIAALSSSYCSSTGSEARENAATVKSALTTGWLSMGPGGALQPNGEMYTGTTTDFEYVASTGTYRIASLGRGVLEWTGSAWQPITDNLDPTPYQNPPQSGYGLEANTLASKPGDPNTLLFGTAGENQHGANHGGTAFTSGIWLGTKTSGVWSWSQVLSPANSGDVFKLRWSDSQTVHAATSQGYWISRSAGQSGTWTQVFSDYSTDLAILPSNSNVVYVATDETSAQGGLLKMTWTNGSGGWTSTRQVAAQPCVYGSSGCSPAGRSALAVSAAASNVVYYMPGNGGSVLGLWKVTHNDYPTADSSTQFSNCQSGQTTSCFPASSFGGGIQENWDIALAAHPTNSNILMAGAVNLYQTQDGSTWTVETPSKLGHGDIHGLGWSEGGKWAIAVGDGGYFYSGDNGQTWKGDSNTAQAVSTTSLDVRLYPNGPNGSDTVIVGTAWDTGLSYVVTSGQWSGDSPGDSDLTDVLEDPGFEGHMVVLDKNGCCGRTEDYGATWAACNAAGANQCAGHEEDVFGVGINFNAPNGDVLFELNGATVYYSFDFGKTWGQYGDVMAQSIGHIAVSAYDSVHGGNIVYGIGGGGDPNYTLYVQQPDGTGHWTTASATPNPRTAFCVTPHPVAVRTAFAFNCGRNDAPHPGDPPHIAVSLNAGLALADGGSSWTEITGDLPTSITDVHDLVVDPLTNYVIVGTTSGVYRSINAFANGTPNASAHWDRWSTNLPAGGSGMVWRLRLLPWNNGYNVYAGVWGAGIWMRSTTDG